MKKPEDPTFFPDPRDLRGWLERHAEDGTELWVGFYRKDSGIPSVTWPESVDEALCFGWIDGVRKRIDDTSYKIRFTPRKPGSTWSAVNIRRVGELEAEGRMQPSGGAAFERRLEARSGIYSYEQPNAAAFTPEQETIFRSSSAAWDYFNTQAPSYRSACIWHVVTARRPETREKRLRALIEASSRKQRLE